jgi:hypothetical protein
VGIPQNSEGPQTHVLIRSAADGSEMRAELAELRNAMARHRALQADLHAQLAMATEARATAEQERLAAVSHAQHASVDLQAQVLSFFKPALQFAQSVCDPLTPVLPLCS